MLPLNIFVYNFLVLVFFCQIAMISFKFCHLTPKYSSVQTVPNWEAQLLDRASLVLAFAVCVSSPRKSITS